MHGSIVPRVGVADEAQGALTAAAPPRPLRRPPADEAARPRPLGPHAGCSRTALIASATNTPAPRRGRPKTERMLQIARQILAVLTQDHPQSVRHVFYRLLDPTLPLPLPKTEAGYKCVQRALVDLRRSGQVPYSWISDATRWGYYVSAYQHAADALPAAASAYRVDLWSQADTYVEVWTESRSMVGVIRDVIDELAVPLYAAGGFSSLTLANNAAEHIGRLANGRPVRILYIGDWDPAGVLIDEKVLDALRGHLPDLDIAERRLAITAEQAAELPSKPRKRGEKRRPDIAANRRSRGDAGRRAAGVTAPHGRRIPAAPRAGDHQDGRSAGAGGRSCKWPRRSGDWACRAPSKRWPAERTDTRSMSTHSRRDGASHGAAGRAVQTRSTPRPHRRRARRRAPPKEDDHVTARRAEGTVHAHRAEGVPGSVARAVACRASRRGAQARRQPLGPHVGCSRTGLIASAPTISDPRGSVILQSAGDVRLTNAPAGRNGASSGDRRKRRGLPRVTPAAWPSRSRCRQGGSANRRGNDHSRKPDALDEALGMVIDTSAPSRAPPSGATQLQHHADTATGPARLQAVRYSRDRTEQHADQNRAHTEQDTLS